MHFALRHLQSYIVGHTNVRGKVWAITTNFDPPPEPPQTAPAASPGPRGPGKTIYVGCGADSVPTNSRVEGCSFSLFGSLRPVWRWRRCEGRFSSLRTSQPLLTGPHWIRPAGRVQQNRVCRVWSLFAFNKLARSKLWFPGDWENRSRARHALIRRFRSLCAACVSAAPPPHYDGGVAAAMGRAPPKLGADRRNG